jgi:hypothetical protein
MSEKEIWVKYSVVDGAHFFTGADLLSQGLCVAHVDLKTAFDEVPVQLKKLLLLNHGMDSTVEPGLPFDEFATFAKSSPKIQKKSGTVPFELEPA